MTSRTDNSLDHLRSDGSSQDERARSSWRRPGSSPSRDLTTHDPAVIANENNTRHGGSDAESDTHGNGSFSRPVRRTTLSKSYTAVEERTVLRKLDRHLTMFLCLLYLLSFLDRSNIGNAKVAGLQTSLGITSSQFDLTLLAFYVTYITFEWMILLYRLVPPHIYIAVCVFSWGLVACLQSMVQSLEQLLVLRALLGITEAAFGPGVPFYMTFFYRREELAYRVGLQISAAPLATSFASSLAWVIIKLSEKSPLETWRALFLFEGFPSIIAAVFAYYLIPDSPSQAPWLTPRERKIAVLRVHDSVSSRSTSRPSSSSKLNTTDLLTTLTDPKAWLTSLMFLSVNVSFASLPVFLPTIINDMSFSPLTSQILAAPPYLLAFAFVLIVGHTSDRIPDSRSWFLIACASLSCISYSTIAITGFLSQRDIIPSTLSIIIRYVAVYGAAMGLFASVVLIITWQLNNQQSTTGKGVGMVILNVVGQTGPLVGVKLFPGEDQPYFVKGMFVCAGFMGLVVLLAAGLRVYLGILNRRASKVGKGGYEMVVFGGADENGDGIGGEELEGLVSGREDDDEGGGRGGSSGDGGGGKEVFRFML